MFTSFVSLDVAVLSVFTIVWIQQQRPELQRTGAGPRQRCRRLLTSQLAERMLSGVGLRVLQLLDLEEWPRVRNRMFSGLRQRLCCGAERLLGRRSRSHDCVQGIY